MSNPQLLRAFGIPTRDRVLRSFFQDTSMLSCIMGPVGGAKTSTSLLKFLPVAMNQAPHPDGVRRTRHISVRSTYRDLERTTLRTWKNWFSQSRNWRGGANGEPAEDTHVWGMPDGTTCEMHVLFPAVGETDIEKFAGGFEITSFHIAEADKEPEELYMKLLERIGRYPAVDKAIGFAGASWKGGWLDCNAPNFGNHIERNFVTKPIDGFAFYRQPGGLDPDAENLYNLPGGRKYYIDIAKRSPEHTKRRMIDNLFGYDRSGKPVYQKYNPFVHRANLTLEPLKGRRLVCGLDQGWNAAASWWQRDIAGGLRGLRELPVFNTPPREFGRALKQQWLEEFPEFDPIFVADPAAFNRTDISRDDDDVWALIVQSELGVPIVPGLTSKRAALEAPLHAAMQQNTLTIDPSMEMLHDGLNQNFRYKKLTRSGERERYADTIDKTDESHACEAAEFAVSYLTGMPEILHGRRTLHMPPPAADLAAENWRPMGFG
jgi:hypothetical protein